MNIKTFVLLAGTISLPALSAAPANSEPAITSAAVAKTINDLSHLEGLSAETKQANLAQLIAIGNNATQYKTHLPADEFADVMLRLISAIGSSDFGNKSQYYFAQKFSMETLNSLKSSDLPINTECALLRYTNRNIGPDGNPLPDSEWAALRRRQATAFLQAWAKINKINAEPWNPNDPGERSVRPPKQSGLQGGVDPNEIADAELRAQYVAAIQANDTKRRIFKAHTAALTLEDTWIPSAQRYLFWAYSHEPKNDAELRALVKEHLGETPAAVKLLDAVATGILPPRPPAAPTRPSK